MTIKVLFVDAEKPQEPVFTQAFKQQLKNGKYSFYFSTSSKEAFKKLLAGLEVDIIVFDTRLSNTRDGITLIKKINETNEIKTHKFILCSAYIDSIIIAEAVENGVFNFLNKPHDAEDLEKIIDELYSLEKEV